MKKTILLIAVLAFLPLLASAQDEDYYSGSFVRMTYVKGDVVVKKAGDLGSEAGVANVIIVEGDQLESKNGRAEVSFGRKNYLRVDSDTIVEFSNLPRRDDNRVRLHLLSGNIYLRINQLQEEKTFEVHTPDASFYILEEGLYRFDARGNGETELSVLEGSAEAAGEGGSQLIGSRERIVAANGQLGSQSSASYGRDDFDSWNKDRDAVQTQYVSKRYLPSELDDYESELSDNGYWTYENPYGYVWVPYVHSYPNWRPYHYGYWDWYASCGWGWIPYESWGWPVYHYGRWGWGINLGWYWIPQSAWGPAWVNWYWGYDYCGWSPLSYYNYPCVLADNRFYDRYHGGHYPCGSHAMTVVHKNQLQNRHISDVALSRTEAGRLGSVPMQAKQPDIRPTVRSSELQKATPSKIQSAQPQIRPSSLGKSQLAPTSPSQLKSTSVGQGRVVTGERPSSQGSQVTTKSLSRSGGVASYPSSSSAKRTTEGTLRSRPESAGPASSSARQIRTYDSSSKSRASFAAPTVRSYSSSPRVSSSNVPGSVVSKSTPRVYEPSASITRYGTGPFPALHLQPIQSGATALLPRSRVRLPAIPRVQGPIPGLPPVLFFRLRSRILRLAATAILLPRSPAAPPATPRVQSPIPGLPRGPFSPPRGLPRLPRATAILHPQDPLPHRVSPRVRGQAPRTPHLPQEAGPAAASTEKTKPLPLSLLAFGD
jgi:hypothetical protein